MQSPPANPPPPPARPPRAARSAAQRARTFSMTRSSRMRTSYFTRSASVALGPGLGRSMGATTRRRCPVGVRLGSSCAAPLPFPAPAAAAASPGLSDLSFLGVATEGPALPPAGATVASPGTPPDLAFFFAGPAYSKGARNRSAPQQ